MRGRVILITVSSKRKVKFKSILNSLIYYFDTSCQQKATVNQKDQNRVDITEESLQKSNRGGKTRIATAERNPKTATDLPTSNRATSKQAEETSQATS